MKRLSRMRRLSLLAQFSILSLALFVVIGALLGYNLTQFFQDQALQQEELVVSGLVTPIVGAYIDKTVLAEGATPPPKGATEAEKSRYVYSRIERALSNLGGAGLVRVKIWNTDGMVAYSDDPKLVRQKFPITDNLRQALDGRPIADISPLDKSENTDERGFGQLLEVYTPLRLQSGGEVVGAIEGYYDIQDLRDRISLTNSFLWTSIFTGFLFLYVSLFTIVRNASQRILRQSSENMRLLADTERKAARLELVNELARSINRSALDLDEVFGTALRGIDRIVRHSGASITLLNDCGHAPVRTIVSSEAASGGVSREEVEAEIDLLSQRAIFVSGDTRLGEPPVLRMLAEQGALSLLLISICLGDRRLGMLRVVSSSPGTFDDNDASILKGVADQLAVAIENTRLIKETAETTALRETNRLKDDFVSMISHELRTPLSSIKGYSRTLLAGDGQWDRATRQEFIRIISDESDKLQELVENLLEMSRIEGGRLPIAIEPLLLRRFCREVVAAIARQYPRINFECNLDAALPVVEADPRRVEQVLVNLLQNAAKYSGAEQVCVQATYDSEAGEVQVRVADNGIGIAPEHLPHLFDKFYRAQWNQADSGTGTGLGLAIARALVEAQGGRIWVESSLGEGAAFYFTLPALALDGSEAVRG